MIEPAMVEHVDCPDLLTSPECQARGCRRSFMARLSGDSAWQVYHATGERWAMIPVPPEMTDDQPMMLSLVPQFHETMDRVAKESKA